MKKRFNACQKMVIEVYKKKQKKVFCKIEIDDQDVFDDMIATLNSPSRFIMLTDGLIVDKTDIDYIILN